MYSLVLRSRTGKTVTVPMIGAGIMDVISLAEMQIRQQRIVLGYTVRENGHVHRLTPRGVANHYYLAATAPLLPPYYNQHSS